MNKINSITKDSVNTQGVPKHDRMSSKQKSAIISMDDALQEEIAELLGAYQKKPSASTYHGYLVAQAKIESFVTETEYKAPKKYHDYSMADLLLKIRNDDSTNFFISILNRFKRKGLWSIPTMAVGASSGTYYFGYHPEWYKYHSLTFCKMVICHETHHLLQNHLPRLFNILNTMRPLDEDNPTTREAKSLNRLKQFTNIAADEDVNSLLKAQNQFYHVFFDHQDELVVPSHYNHPERLAYEQYLNMWLLNPFSIFTVNGGGGEGPEGEEPLTPEEKAQEEFDERTAAGEHPWIDDLLDGTSLPPDKEEQEAMEKEFEKLEEFEELRQKGKLREKDGDGPEGKFKIPARDKLERLADSLEHQRNSALIKTTREHINQRGRSSVPGGYLEEFDELTKECKLHWTDILSNMISDPKILKESYKINKYNRNNILLKGPSKYGFKEEDNTYRIWVSLDTSGSMCRNDIQEGLAVIQGLLRVDSEIQVTICEFDSAIQRITHMTADSKHLTTVEGRGGTDFNCVFYHLQEKVPEDIYPDIHIIFTDGGAPPPKEQYRIPEHKLPLLWVLTSQNPTSWFKDGYGEILQTVSD